MEPLFSFFFIVLFCWLVFNDFSWSGRFYFLDRLNFLLLYIIRVFILGVVVFSEKNFLIIVLRLFLVLICLFFFFSSNLMILYVFFELSIFPILVMILGFGNQVEKVGASYYLIFYAIFCSIPFLYVYFNIAFVYVFCYYDYFLSWELTFILRLSFIIKFPVYFLHLWLPKAHVEAPTTARMLLAGLLLKLGTGGFLRIMGLIGFVWCNFWLVISFFGMIIASFCCIFQRDSKSLAAYSSVSHMGFLLFSLVFLFLPSKTGGLILILAHGYTSTIIFFLIGEFYHRVGSRMIYFMRGFLGSRLIFGVVFSLVFLSNGGVPPSMSFISEFLVISSGFLLVSSFFYLIFVYFFVSFYYSVFLITCSLLGKNFINSLVFNFGFGFFLMFIMYNIFWLRLFF